MSENLYRPPQAELVDPVAATGDLATRASRFWAAMIDGLIAMTIFMPIMWAAGVFEGFPNIRPMGIGLTLGFGLLGLAINLGLNGWLVAKRGQTLGKAALGIKMVRSNGDPLDLGRWLGLRVLPLAVAGQVPVVNQFAGLVDMLAIFRSDRRCIHDLIADTIVIRA